MRDLTSAEPDFGPHTQAVRRVLHEVRDADALTFALAAVPRVSSADPSRATSIAWRAAVTAGRAQAWAAAWQAAEALAGDVSPGGVAGAEAAVDAALAEVVSDGVPEAVHRAMSSAWRAAVMVRAQLRALGSEAERLAASLLEVGWTDPVDGLPDVARGTRRLSPVRPG